MTAASVPHVPVLLDEVLSGLDPKRGETHVDGTFGAGGYTRALLAAGANVIAFDRDPDAIAEGQALMRDLRGRVSGLCQPTYVLDIPGGHGKTVISASTIESQGGGCYTVSDFRGNAHSYPPRAE